MSHSNLANGRWSALSLTEQLGNIGSEVGRARNWKEKDRARFEGALERALELFDLTLQDRRWSGLRRREIARAREIFCDATLGAQEYNVSLEKVEKYFYSYAVAARLLKTRI